MIPPPHSHWTFHKVSTYTSHHSLPIQTRHLTPHLTPLTTTLYATSASSRADNPSKDCTPHKSSWNEVQVNPRCSFKIADRKKNQQIRCHSTSRVVGRARIINEIITRGLFWCTRPRGANENTPAAQSPSTATVIRQIGISRSKPCTKLEKWTWLENASAYSFREVS